MPRGVEQSHFIINIQKFPLTINNNGLNDSLSNFWHDGICFDQLEATGNF